MFDNLGDGFGFEVSIRVGEDGREERQQRETWVFYGRWRMDRNALRDSRVHEGDSLLRRWYKQ